MWKWITSVSILALMIGAAISIQYSASTIGPPLNQVYLDFEFELYRSSNGILLLEDYVIKKEVIAPDRIRYEILIDYKTNPLMLKNNNKQDHKLGHKMDRRIVYYKMIDRQWILTNR